MRQFGLYTVCMLVACTGNEVKVNELLPDLAVSQDLVDFGEHKVGETLNDSIQLINAGQAELSITSIEVTGDGSSVFTLTEVPVSIAVQEVVDLSIEFLPADLETYEAELVILSNDEENPEYRIALSGVGGLGPLPDIELSETTLDFGAIATGEESILFLTVRNDGTAPLEIARTEQTGSGAFAFLTDLDGQTLPAGVETSVVVSYQPMQDQGDQGQLTIFSDDPDESEVSVNLIGNGGGESTYPVATLSCPSNVSIGDQVTIDGGTSTDPNQLDLTYHWSALQIPVGSSASVTTATDSTSVNMDIDLAGVYQVGLVVENSNGQRSPQAECLWNVEPAADIYAELSWQDSQADFDLHLSTTYDGLFQFESDCCWCNPEPAWSSTSAANPVLLNDSEDGSEAEVIEIAQAEDGEYYFRVHYFSDNGAGSSDATLRIYVEGLLVAQYSETMTHNQMWNVGFVRWPSRTLAEELDNPTDWASSRTCQ